MKYSTHIFPEYKTKVNISSFQKQNSVSEYHLVLYPIDNTISYEQQLKSLQKTYLKISEHFPEKNAEVMKRYFVSDAANQTIKIKEIEKDTRCPVSIVQQPPLNGSKVAIWIWLQSDMEENKTVRFSFSHNGYTHYRTDAYTIEHGNSEQQTQNIFEQYEQFLEQNSCTVREHCIRTWLFVQNVDCNYAGVVKGRKENFIKNGLTEKTHYITSTGIEGRNANPNSLVSLETYAIKGLENGQQKYLYAPEFLNPTYEYGVTFERGISIEYGDRKQIFISGTASINNKGEIVHPGDIRAQTERTWENVNALLKEAGSSFEDVAQIIVYLRDTADYEIVRNMFEKRFPDIPQIIVWAPVCRPGWLIEMECIAINNFENPKFKKL